MAGVVGVEPTSAVLESKKGNITEWLKVLQSVINTGETANIHIL